MYYSTAGVSFPPVATSLSHLIAHGHVERNEGPPRLQLPGEELALGVLIPGLVAAIAQVGGHSIQGVCVACALLAQVQLEQRHAKAVHTPDEVQQAAISNHAASTLPQGPAAHMHRHTRACTEDVMVSATRLR